MPPPMSGKTTTRGGGLRLEVAAQPFFCSCQSERVRVCGVKVRAKTGLMTLRGGEELRSSPVEQGLPG